MTKNEDVSWIPAKPRCNLNRFTTADLVNELASREGTTMYEVKEGQQCSITIDYNDVDYTNHMPAAWILEVLK